MIEHLDRVLLIVDNVHLALHGMYQVDIASLHEVIYTNPHKA
jgi:hypothetical protein